MGIVDPAMFMASVRRGLALRSIPSTSMRQLLAALVLSTAVPLLVLALVMFQQLIAHDRQAIRVALMSNTRSLAALIDNEIDTHMAVAGTLATSQALDSGDLATFQRQARKALEIIPGTWLSLSDPSGHYVMSTLSELGEPLPSRGNLDVMTRAWATGKPQVSDVVIGSISKRPFAFIEYPVFKAGAPHYSIVLGLNPDRFQALTRDKFGEALVGIIDRQHKFVARVPDHDARLGTPASEGWQAAIAHSPEGFAEITTLEGLPSLGAYVPTRERWTAGLFLPRSVLDAPVRRILLSVGGLGLALTLASLAFALSLGRRLSHMMTSLAKAARKAGQGEIVTAGSFPVVEATAISQTLSSASEKLAVRQAALRETMARLELGLKVADLGLGTIDYIENTIVLDETAAAIFALPAGTPVARSRVHARFHPGDAAEVNAKIAAYLACASNPNLAVEHRIVLPDGTVRWVSVRKHNDFVQQGPGRTPSVNGLLAVIDITQRKAAETTLIAARDTFRQLVERSPFGIYVVDADFRLMQVSAGAQKVFENVRPLIGRDFPEVLRCIWPEPFSSEVIGRFRHTLETGEAYHSTNTVEHRRDIDEVESYDWKIERVRMLDGRFGVVCHFYDQSERQRYEAAPTSGLMAGGWRSISGYVRC